MADKKPAVQSSVTFQTSKEKRERLEAQANAMGFVRMSEGRPVGNVSLVINLFIDFALANLPSFTEWMSKRTKAPAKG